MNKIAYKIDEAADQVGVSSDTIRRAIRQIKPGAYPPPLRAKNAGTDKKPSYRILHAELERWAASLADA